MSVHATEDKPYLCIKGEGMHRSTQSTLYLLTNGLSLSPYCRRLKRGKFSSRFTRVVSAANDAAETLKAAVLAAPEKSSNYE